MEITTQMKELCFIYHKRNMLGRERDSLRHKYRYLQDIKRALQVRDNYESSELYTRTRRSLNVPHGKVQGDGNVAILAAARIQYLKDNPITKRFKETSLTQMNMMLLEAEAKVCKIKLKVMQHTKKYEKRIRELAPVQEHFGPRYICGLVRSLGFFDKETDEWTYVGAKDMERYHNELMANKAIDKMLTG